MTDFPLPVNKATKTCLSTVTSDTTTQLDVEWSCTTEQEKARNHDSTKCNSTANHQYIDDEWAIPNVVAQFK